MKAGQTEFEVGTRVRLKNLIGNDSIYNGLEGEITHPFAFGCTDKGWLGFRSETYTVYGYHFNVQENEIEVL